MLWRMCYLVACCIFAALVSSCSQIASPSVACRYTDLSLQKDYTANSVDKHSACLLAKKLCQSHAVYTWRCSQKLTHKVLSEKPEDSVPR